MALNHPLDGIRGGPTKAQRQPLTAVVAYIEDGEVYAAPLGGDLRSPIGPCRGGTGLAVGDVCLLIWTQERPWALPG